MTREAFISGGVAYHLGLTERGQPLDGFEVVELGALKDTNLHDFDVVVVPRSTDGDALHARRYQFARYLDQGGVLIALGEQWADWFPGSHWEAECAADLLPPVIARAHPIVADFDAADLYWHPARERWCCHGHLIAPASAEVIVRNQRGDAWLYVDRTTTNGVIVASTNLDPDTHTFHHNANARRFFEQLVAWARAEVQLHTKRIQQQHVRRSKIAGLYSGVHFQHAFYTDPEFAPSFAVLPVWELAATDLRDYAALWIPRESNQSVLLQQRAQLAEYLQTGGTIVCFDEVNQPWLPAGVWEHRPVDMDTLRVADHHLMRNLRADQVRWHAHGTYDVYDGADILIDDSSGNVLLYVDERSFAGTLLAGTLDPDCHAGYGAEITRPLLRAILEFVLSAHGSLATASIGRSDS